MTATEASRAFATVLDEAERGQTIVVTRGGRRIAVIGPAPRGSGRELKALFHGRPRDLGDDWADDVLSAREVTADKMRDTWPDV